MAKRNFFNYVFLWGIALLHVYVIFNRNFSSVNAGKTHVTGDAGSKGGCPFTLARSFFGRQGVMIANSLFVGRPLGAISTSDMDIAGKTASTVIKTDLGMVGSPHTRRAMNALEYVRKSSIRGRRDELPAFELFAQTEPITSSTVAPPQPVNVATTVPVPFETPEAIPQRPGKNKNEAAKAAAGDNNNNKKKKNKKKGGKSDALETIVLGLSHHNAKVEVREKLAIPEDEWNVAAENLCEYESISEASVLSTCNRFEIYLAGKNQYACMRDAVDFLYQRAKGELDLPTLRRNLFMLSGEDAIWHLLRVSAGLDSLVVGEGQILSQVKRSYEHCNDKTTGSGGKVVSRLLNTAVSAGKRVRSETGIAKGAVSISSAAAEFTATKIGPDCKVESMSDARITIIGAGKMARLLLIHLQTQGVTEVTIINRSMERVLALQEEFPNLKIDIKLMDEMWETIKNSDVVYPSTASTTTIIDPEPLKEALSAGRSRPGGVAFVDISVPRNVHPDCEEVEGAFCYNVDDLKAVVQRNTAKRRREMLEAELILKEELDKYRLWQQSLGAIPTIARLQEKAEALRQDEIAKAANKLSNLNQKDLEMVNKITKGIVAKLLHGPMSHLRQQTEGDATRAAILQVQQAFQLEEASST